MCKKRLWPALSAPHRRLSGSDSFGHSDESRSHHHQQHGREDHRDEDDDHLDRGALGLGLRPLPSFPPNLRGLRSENLTYGDSGLLGLDYRLNEALELGDIGSLDEAAKRFAAAPPEGGLPHRQTEFLAQRSA